MNGAMSGAARPAPPGPKGRLYLVPTPLDHGCGLQMPLSHVLPEHSLRTAAGLSHWISENAKSTRAFLKRVAECSPLAAPLPAMQITELPRQVHKKGDHDAAASGGWDASALLQPALAGQDMGLVSEAGMPAIADPGSSVVRAAHALGIEVVPLVGPVSIALALAASGLNGQNFAFVGYLPRDAATRAQRIRGLQALALGSQQTQLFIETPYRNTALLQALVQTLKPDTRLATASALSLPAARVQCMAVRQWRAQLPQLLADTERWAQPTVFAVGA